MVLPSCHHNLCTVLPLIPICTRSAQLNLMSRLSARFSVTEDWGFLMISTTLLAISMILTCVMDYFQSGCKGLGGERCCICVCSSCPSCLLAAFPLVCSCFSQQRSSTVQLLTAAPARSAEKIFLNVTELRLLIETYRALQMWKRGLKPQRGFAQVLIAQIFQCSFQAAFSLRASLILRDAIGFSLLRIMGPICAWSTI